jgi:hypothetical protein
VVMLEDQSTNGTKVDNVTLHGKDREKGATYKHVLQQGSRITLIMTPPEEDIKFVVQIPQHEGQQRGGKKITHAGGEGATGGSVRQFLGKGSFQIQQHVVCS